VSGPSNHDEALLEQLRSLLELADPVPSEVTEFARAALGWRSLDAELAELVADSVLETEATSLTRAGGAGGRRLGFRSGELEIDAELTVERETCTLRGQLVPAPPSATVEVHGADGAVVASTAVDSLGRFLLVFAKERRIRLGVIRIDPVGPPVETSWLTLG
jgi:hypothetical protein